MAFKQLTASQKSRMNSRYRKFLTSKSSVSRSNGSSGFRPSYTGQTKFSGKSHYSNTSRSQMSFKREYEGNMRMRKGSHHGSVKFAYKA